MPSAGTKRAARPAAGRAAGQPLEGSVLNRFERASDDAELVADLTAEKDQANDRDDRNEGKNECVFGQPLAVVRASDAFHEGGESPEQRHPLHLLSARITRIIRSVPRPIPGLRPVRSKYGF